MMEERIKTVAVAAPAFELHGFEAFQREPSELVITSQAFNAAAIKLPGSPDFFNFTYGFSGLLWYLLIGSLIAISLVHAMNPRRLISTHDLWSSLWGMFSVLVKAEPDEDHPFQGAAPRQDWH